MTVVTQLCPPCRQSRATRAGHPKFGCGRRKAGPPAWKSENYLLLHQREKCFLLTSPFIEPAKSVGDNDDNCPALAKIRLERCTHC